MFCSGNSSITTRSSKDFAKGGTTGSFTSQPTSAGECSPSLSESHTSSMPSRKSSRLSSILSLFGKKNGKVDKTNNINLYSTPQCSDGSLLDKERMLRTRRTTAPSALDEQSAEELQQLYRKEVSRVATERRLAREQMEREERGFGRVMTAVENIERNTDAKPLFPYDSLSSTGSLRHRDTFVDHSRRSSCI